MRFLQCILNDSNPFYVTTSAYTIAVIYFIPDIPIHIQNEYVHHTNPVHTKYTNTSVRPLSAFIQYLI